MDLAVVAMCAYLYTFFEDEVGEVDTLLAPLTCSPSKCSSSFPIRVVGSRRAGTTWPFGSASGPQRPLGPFLDHL